MRKKIEDIKRNIEQVLVGKSELIEMVIISLLSGGHILLEDVPGVGKTTLATALAKTVNCGFNRIQFTPDTLPSDITGASVYNMQTGGFEFVKGAIMNHFILADEINRTSPKTQASLLEAMEEGQVTADGNTYRLPQPFMIIATQNPIEYMGTYHLPEAQMDRFFMRLSIGYPSEEEEVLLAKRFLTSAGWKEIAAVVSGEEILTMQAEVKNVQVHDDMVDYMVRIIRETRINENFSLGASPRALLSLTRGAQAMAYFKEREFIIPEDVLAVVEPVLSHRVILSTDARLNKKKVENVLTGIICQIKVPIL